MALHAAPRRPRGFLKVIDEKTLAFADYRGNRQYISTGNLAADRRACLFLMDYPHKARLKIYAYVETLALGDDPDLTTRVSVQGSRAAPDAFFGCLKTFDWNCCSTSSRVSLTGNVEAIIRSRASGSA